MRITNLWHSISNWWKPYPWSPNRIMVWFEYIRTKLGERLEYQIEILDQKLQSQDRRALLEKYIITYGKGDYERDTLIKDVNKLNWRALRIMVKVLQI